MDQRPASKTSTPLLRISGVARQSRREEDRRTSRVRVLGQRDILLVAGCAGERLAAIAGLQRGRVSRRQLLAVGMTKATIETMLRHGRLYRLHRGVYAVGHLAPIELGRETAALLAMAGDAVLSHGTAAAIWNLRPPGPEIEVTVVGSVARKRPGIGVHRTTRLHPSERRLHKDLPLTSPARTLLDLAPHVTARELERALDEGLTRRIVRLSQLSDVLSRANGHAGAAMLRALVQDRRPTTVTRSPTEEIMLKLIRQAKLPPPEMNVRMHGYEADFFWREQGVVVEVDSYTYHTSRSAFERDRRKDAVFRSAGLDVLRFSRYQIKAEPYFVIAQVMQALTRRTRQIA
jgi:very-short-patch-repair endonuclease